MKSDREWAYATSEDTKRQGNLLRRVRESANLTMRQLAMQVGISHTAISQLEHGKLDLPRARVEQIVEACGHEMADFDRMMGKGFIELNYRDECHSLIKSFDEDTLKLLFSVMKRLRLPSKQKSQPNQEV